MNAQGLALPSRSEKFFRHVRNKFGRAIKLGMDFSLPLISDQRFNMKQMYIEDFILGMSITTAETSVTESDVMAFAAVSGDNNPLHTDPEYARQSPMGRPVAHGLLGISKITGLTAGKGSPLDGTALAFLGIEEWKFHAPVYFDDRIRLKWTVTDKRMTRNGQAGVLKRKMEVFNHRDELVQSGVFVTLVRSRHADSVEPKEA